MPQPLGALVITGPTASGKSALAMALAARLPLEIICADSAQVYRGMDIGTAKPSHADRQAAAHHLLDVRDPSQPYTAMDFCQDALRLARDIQARGRLPALVGGAMLYLRALRDGLSPLPPADLEVRQAIRDEAEARGWPALHEELARVDPKAAERIPPGDPQRLGRALEVYRQTGKPLSHWQAAPAQAPDIRLTQVALLPPDRAALHLAIEARFHKMLEGGFLDEVRALHARGDLHPGLPAMKAVGYRQAWAHLEGELSHTQMVDRALAATRGLAKRQCTWLRAWPGLHRLAAADVNQVLKIAETASILDSQPGKTPASRG